MEIKENRTIPVTVDVLCDVCGGSTVNDSAPQFGTLSAQWGYGSTHDGEHYEVHLCEMCFFRTLAGLKRERMVNHMFDEAPENSDQPQKPFGLVRRDAFFND